MYFATAISKMAAKKFKNSLFFGHAKCKTDLKNCSLKDFDLLSSATLNSSIVSRVNSGTPVDVLKVWYSDDSGKWLLVNVLSKNFNQFFYKRGWVNIGTS